MMNVHLNAANFLIDKELPLSQRLGRFYDAIPGTTPDISQDAQLEIARAALLVVHRVQLWLDVESDPIGTRDLALLRALLAVLFQWGINPLLARLAPSDLDALFALLSSLMSTLFPRGVHAQPPQTFITSSILNRYVPDLLAASIALAWLPKSRHPKDSPDLHLLRPPVLRLLEFLPLPQVMTDLGAILSSSPPPHVRKLCSSLLTKSLLRPGGVRALFAAVFGEHEGAEDPQLEKYEHTTTILITVPAGHRPEEYFPAIVPRLMDSLSNCVPAAHRRAASFSISRMLDPEFSHRQLIWSLVSPIIHDPIMHVADQQGPSSTAPSTALSMLTILLLNTDPSPPFVTQVLSPVLPALYALMFHLDTTKASDPVLKESLKGLLATWGRVAESQPGVNALWAIIQSERIYWEVDIAGNIKYGAPKPSRLALLTPEDINRGDDVMGENFLDLYPDPVHFVQYIKSIDRQDIASEMFVRLLEAYHSVDAEQDTDPARGLLYLQLTVQMQTQLSDEFSTSNILRQPGHILSFIKHVLDSYGIPGTSSVQNKTKHSRGLGLEDLKIVDQADDMGNDDSDADSAELENSRSESNMTETAINLLLAVLEANPELSARTAPVLNEIFSLLDPFSNDTSETIRGLTREARMVMTARLASSSTSWSAPQKRDDDESPQKTYQKALKLLQDPILPVRAHGLLLLRQLVSSRPRGPAPATDAALVPAILSIFMQSVQDDDSYIFLNAVQGLSAMVDAFGREVLSHLLETYTRNLSPSSVGTWSKQEVDAKVRVGEALGQVIRRCGDALGVHYIIVPRLVLVFASSYAPTVLRTSAVSLLTQCIKTSMVSVFRHTNDVAMSLIDFLQVEMISTVQSQSPPKAGDGETRQGESTEALDSEPTAIDPKLPPLRRAALHFWTTLLNELTRATYDGAVVEKLPTALLKRAKVTLGYVASSDEDGRVRMMAREASEAVDQLYKATLGI